MTEQEIQSLKSSKSQAELTAKAERIRESIKHTFSDKSPHRITQLNEVDNLVGRVSAILPAFSKQELHRIEMEVATSSNRHQLEAVLAKYARQVAANMDVQAAVNLGVRRWEEDERARIALKAQKEKQRQIAEMAEAEFSQLVEEMSAMGFTHSKQVSAYIVRNKLGHKYKYICGVLEMELDGDVWNFDGGFPPEVYKRLCDALGLKNNGSQAYVRKFTPYEEIISH
jgi:hypothetical protein